MNFNLLSLKEYALDILSENKIRAVLKYSPDYYIYCLCTFLLKHNELDLLFLIVNEMTNLHIDTSHIQNEFWEIASIRSLDGTKIDRFLKSIHKDRKYYIDYLIANEEYLSLYRHLQYLCLYKKKEDIYLVIDLIAEKISSYYVYSECAIIILRNQNFDYACKALNARYDETKKLFGDNLIVSARKNFKAVENYCDYLLLSDYDDFLLFEEKFINASFANELLIYAGYTHASLRKILVRIVALKDEDCLIEFIKSFPQYNYLILLL